jgi:hypothetical protein
LIGRKGEVPFGWRYGRAMRITVSHTKSKDQIVKAVDRSFDDLFKGTPLIPIHVTNEKRRWEGSTLIFSFNAAMGLLSSPIKGTAISRSRRIWGCLKSCWAVEWAARLRAG